VILPAPHFADLILCGRTPDLLRLSITVCDHAFFAWLRVVVTGPLTAERVHICRVDRYHDTLCGQLCRETIRRSMSIVPAKITNDGK
jgi:hypothetical protein